MDSRALLIRAEHSLAPLAPFAAPASLLNPRRAHPVSYFSRGDVGGHGDDLADRLVSQNSRELARNVSQSFVYVRVADAACVHLHQDLIGAGLGLRNVFDLPRTAYSGYNSSLHMSSSHAGSPYARLLRQNVLVLSGCSRAIGCACL